MLGSTRFPERRGMRPCAPRRGRNEVKEALRLARGRRGAKRVGVSRVGLRTNEAAN